MSVSRTLGLVRWVRVRVRVRAIIRNQISTVIHKYHLHIPVSAVPWWLSGRMLAFQPGHRFDSRESVRDFILSPLFASKSTVTGNLKNKIAGDRLSNQSPLNKPKAFN